MMRPWGDSGLSLAEEASDEVTNLFKTLIVDASTFDAISDRCDLALLAYGGGVRDLLDGDGPVSLSSAAWMSETDAPQWLVPTANGSPTLVAALEHAASVVEEWCASNRRGGAIVTVYSSGACADGDLAAAAERVKQHALLFLNVLTPSSEIRAAFPRTTQWLPTPHAEAGAALLNAASEVPLALSQTMGSDRQLATADTRARWVLWNEPDAFPISAFWGGPLLQPVADQLPQARVLPGVAGAAAKGFDVAAAVQGLVASPWVAEQAQRARVAVASWWQAGGKQWAMNVAKDQIQKNLQQNGHHVAAAALNQINVGGAAGAGLGGNAMAGMNVVPAGGGMFDSPAGGAGVVRNAPVNVPAVPDPNGEVLSPRLIRHPDVPDVTAQLLNVGPRGILFTVAGIQMQATPGPEGLDVQYMKPGPTGQPQPGSFFLEYGAWKTMWDATWVDAPASLQAIPGQRFELRVRWA
jgi:hypothetical protein